MNNIEANNEHRPREQTDEQPKTRANERIHIVFLSLYANDIYLHHWITIGAKEP